MGFLDLVFPRRCVGCRQIGGYFCDECRGLLRFLGEPVCPQCGKGAIGGKTHPRCQRAQGMDGLVSVLAYDGTIRRAIKKLKFRFITDLADELVAVVEGQLGSNAAVAFFKEKEFVMVAVPLHIRRERWRGFNQAAELGRRLADGFELEFVPGILERTRETESQAEMRVDLSRKEERDLREKSVSEFDYEEKVKQFLRGKRLRKRYENVRGAFKISEKLKTKSEKLKGKNILLVDDVWTSGATMRECAKILKRAGVRQIWGMTVAR